MRTSLGFSRRSLLLRAGLAGATVGIVVAAAGWALQPITPSPARPIRTAANHQEQFESVLKDLDRELAVLEEPSLADEVDSEEESTFADPFHLQLTEELLAIRGRLQHLPTAIRELSAQPIDPITLEIASRNHAGLQALRAERSRRQAELETVLTQVQLDSPTHRAVLADLHRSERAYREALEQLRPQFESRLREERTQALHQQLSIAEKALADRLEALHRDLQHQRLQDHQIQKVEPAPVRVPLDLDRLCEARSRIANELAHVQQRPESIEGPAAAMTPTRTRILLVASIVALATSLVVGFADWQLRRQLSSGLAAEEFGLPLLGTVPIGPGAADSDLNDSIDALRAVLMNPARSTRFQTMMVASPPCEEGRFPLAHQLARRFAASGLRTLLLEADLHSPTIHRDFDVPLSPGWAESVCQDVEPSTAIHPCDIENLFLLPAGEASDRVARALEQGTPVTMLLGQFREQFDMIVVDPGPVHPASAALQIGPHLDGVILALRPTQDHLTWLRSMQNQLSMVGTTIVGVVSLSCLNVFPWPHFRVRRNSTMPQTSSASTS